MPAVWASGAAGETPFETRTDFVSAMEAGGVAAMEVVARDLKALGLYQARALAYHGVEVDILVHELSEEQRRIYDSYAGRVQGHPRQHRSRAGGHGHHAGTVDPEQECKVRQR